MLEYASPALKNDKGIVLAAVRSYGLALEFASSEMRADDDIVLAAVRSDGQSLMYASQELLANSQFCKRAVDEWFATKTQRHAASLAWWATGDEGQHIHDDWCCQYDYLTADLYISGACEHEHRCQCKVSTRERRSSRHQGYREMRRHGKEYGSVRANRLLPH